MTDKNVDTGTPTPPDKVADAQLGSEDTTVNLDGGMAPTLDKILEDLTGSGSGQKDAQRLREWIDESISTGQGLKMKDQNGSTILHVAANEGLLEAVRKLTNGKVELDVRDERKRTPLFEACLSGHRDIVECLLDKGADTTLPDEDDKTPLYVAAEIGNKDIAELLLKKSKETLNFKSNYYDWTPLHIAASNGHKETISYLRDEGAKLDVRDEDGWTPLWTAVNWEEARAIEALIKKKENDENIELDTGNSEGRTPLMEAATSGFWEGARLLVEAGAKLDKFKASDSADTDSSSVMAPAEDTVLHLAVSANQFEMVDLLLCKNANVNARNAEGQHCSHLASQKGNEGILKLILDANHSNGLDARDDDGMTPLHLASNAGEPDNDDIRNDEYDDDGSDDDGSDGAGSDDAGSDDDGSDDDESDDDEQGTTYMADDQQDITAIAVNGKTHDNTSTSQSGRYNQVVDLLLQRGANKKAVTKDNKTALELAFHSRHNERGEAILDAIIQDGDEIQDRLLWAARKTKRHTIAISLLKRQLKSSGASLPKSPEGWTAIEWAAYAENPDALWLLIASSPRSQQTRSAIDRAKDLDEYRPQPVKLTTRSRDQQRGDPVVAKETERSSGGTNLIRDYINNPPTGLLHESSDSQEYSKPSFEGKFSSSLEKYKAAIVQFHKQEGRFARIRKSRSVKETIYTEGPGAIMDDVVSMLERLAIGWGEEKTPTFMGAKPKFTWIHLPATNMIWMNDLLQRIMKDQDRPASEFNQAKSFFKDSWIEVPDKFSPSRIMRPRFAWRDTNVNETRIEKPSKKVPVEHDVSDGRNKDETAASAVAASASVATAIYIPYFSYSFHCSDNTEEAGKMEKIPKTHEKLDTRPTKIIESMSKKPLTAEQKAIKPDVKENDFADKLIEKREQYQALLNAYKGKIVHGSSTLDESYYHFGKDAKSQDDKKMRNKSQVVTGSWGHKWGKEKDLGSYWPLIRVNQLWVWTIDEKWLISASSHPIDDHENELLDGLLEALDKQGEAGGSDLQPSSASEMSQFIVEYCVESYERKPRGIDEDRPKDCKLEDLMSIRQTFSKSINSIARDETKLFERFSILTKELRDRSPHMTEIKDAQGRSLDEQLKTATLDAETLAGRVKDILDELNSLEATVNYQQDVQRSMKAMKALKSMKKQAIQVGTKEMKKDKVPETDLSATYIIKDINRLDSVAKRVHDAVNTTLSLQQSEVANLQARFSLEQAKFSIKQADDSAKQGRVLMVFTVVTIVFLPLSFLTSFFALDVSSFQVPAWIIGVIFSVSIAFVVPTVIVAFIPPQSILRFTVNLPGSIAKETSRSIEYMQKFVKDAKEMRIDNGGSNSDPEKGLVPNAGSTQGPTKLQSGV